MLISPVHLKVLAQTLDLAGHDSRAAMRQCGLPPADQLDESEWVPVEAFDRLMQVALEESLDQGFGLTAANSPALVRHGALVTLTLHMPSLRVGLANIQRFAPLLVPRPEVELGEAGDLAVLRVRPIGVSPQGLRFRTEVVMSSMVSLLRMVGCAPDDILGVDFPYGRPSYSHRYAAAFGPRIGFDQPDCVLRFRSRALDLPGPAPDQATYLAALTRAESALQAACGEADPVRQLRDLMLDSLPERVTMIDAARRLQTSERSLRRRLALAGVSYADLLDDCRLLRAQRLLADGRLPLKEVAFALGFSSVSSFHRAFRRWCGTTPAGWRQGQAEARPAG